MAQIWNPESPAMLPRFPTLNSQSVKLSLGIGIQLYFVTRPISHHAIKPMSLQEGVRNCNAAACHHVDSHISLCFEPNINSYFRKSPENWSIAVVIA
jgi:hypothetical protein